MSFTAQLSYVGHYRVAAGFACASFAGVFPLPLTPMELFMIADAREDFGMLCDLELKFEGTIDRPAFETALAIALARNPLLVSLIQRDAAGRWVWVPSGRVPAVDWAPLGTPIAGDYGQRIDLAREIGLRIWVRPGANESIAMFQFQHACTDGIGILAFSEDLMAAYSSALPEGPRVELRPLEPERLKGRGVLGIPPRNFWQQIFDVAVGMREGLRFILQAPVTLVARSAPEQAAGHVVFRSVTLADETVVQLRRLASSCGATLNDLLIRDLMITLRRWQTTSGRKPGRRRLRVLMPQNLRDKDEAAMPATVAMSFAFLTRKASLCDDAEGLLRSIQAETESIRRDKLSLYFQGTIAAVQSAGLLDWILRRPMCFATTVLTNLGNPTRRFVAQFPRVAGQLQVGNLRLVSILGVPPLRPRTRAVWGAFQTASTLSIALKCDPRSYSPLDVEQLLGEYVGQLRASARGASVDPASNARPAASRQD